MEIRWRRPSDIPRPTWSPRSRTTSGGARCLRRVPDAAHRERAAIPAFVAEPCVPAGANPGALVRSRAPSQARRTGRGERRCIRAQANGRPRARLGTYGGYSPTNSPRAAFRARGARPGRPRAHATAPLDLGRGGRSENERRAPAGGGRRGTRRCIARNAKQRVAGYERRTRSQRIGLGSRPLSTSTTSFPGPQLIARSESSSSACRRSLPLPPIKRSLPRSPKSRSDPARPVTVSAPSPPPNASFPGPAKSLSAPAPPRSLRPWVSPESISKMSSAPRSRAWK
jgi:hypothetical protein